MSEGGSYYFGGHNSGPNSGPNIGPNSGPNIGPNSGSYSDYNNLDCLDEDGVDDCAVVNEYDEESQEVDVDTIVIGQHEEKEDEEEADYEDDIEIHEESLED